MEIPPLRMVLEGPKEPKFEINDRTVQDFRDRLPRIIVVGIGGGGSNTVDRITRRGLSGVEMVAINTDKTHLSRINSYRKIHIGEGITRGHGTGGDIELGRRAAENASDRLRQILQGADLIFLAYGLGGGTGTGGGPVIARVAREEGAMVTGIVTTPFNVEKRTEISKGGLKELSKYANSIIVIENDRLSKMTSGLPIESAFKKADEILTDMLKGITETILYPSLINLDFADVKAIMDDGEVMLVGIGEARGQLRKEEALSEALACPLLGEIDYSTSNGAIMQISGSDVTMDEASWIGEQLLRRIHHQAEVIWGARVDSTLEDKLRVILLISGASSPHLYRPSEGGKYEYGGPTHRRERAPVKLNIPSI